MNTTLFMEIKIFPEKFVACWVEFFMETFTENAVEIIKRIPAGSVMTYGQIARLAGSPRGARQVVRILHSMSRKHHLPWHRVINSKGEIALKEDEQIFALQCEGVEVHNGYVNLEKYLYTPEN